MDVSVMRNMPSAMLQNIIEFRKLRQEMNHRVQLIVYRDRMVYDNVTVKLHGVSRYDERGQRLTSLPHDDDSCMCKFTRVCLYRKGFNSYLVSAYVAMLSKSYVYRKNATRVLKHFQTACDRPYDIEHSQKIFIRLRTPRKQFLDYKWSEKLMQMVVERQEADHAMSWLSTLGGAFSALGEEFEHCAKMAGKISVKQFELALRLDNPLLVARCELYAALSFIQRGNFTTPKYMIRKIYKFAIKKKDVRLQNMCQGVWAKLRYSYKQYRQQKKSLKTLSISSEV
ncbi:uncharacterized protein LOC112460627 [Temnothorax curvispinosus]|uniref:Uncharacterized protein LOC112460627 n=1 Tax=Temnothorax curvispinosus TaxID=300111 RepID=A0A6J1QFS7_9HYME|nr:uncharacterized protein LOC112460627 [Temnothorax curvispinosus]